MVQLVKPEGNPETAEIILVGESPSSRELLNNKPFCGPSGWVLDECLRGAGIPREACYITNVFPFKIKKANRMSMSGKMYDQEGNQLYDGRRFSEKGDESVSRLAYELGKVKAKTIIALGDVAFSALTGMSGISNRRGSIYECRILPSKKVIGTIHPAHALHGLFSNRYLIRWDLVKAWRERKFEGLNHPKYSFILNPDFEKSISLLKWMQETKPTIAVDIEVANRQASRITFNWSDTEGTSIEYGDGDWDSQQETQLWLETAKVLEDPEIKKIYHNGAFDIQFLFMIHRIHGYKNIEDTMLAHHVVYTDFPKGLYFLGSLYTNQPYWKDMVKHKSQEIEKEEG